MPAATQKLLLLYSQLRPISLWALVIIIWLPRKCPNLETSSPSTRNIPTRTFPFLSHRNQPRGSKLAKGNGVHPYHAKWLLFPVSRMGHPSVPSKWKAAGFLNYSIWTHWTLSEHTVNHKLQKYASPILVQPASSQNSSLLPCISSSQERNTYSVFFPAWKL